MAEANQEAEEWTLAEVSRQGIWNQALSQLGGKKNKEVRAQDIADRADRLAGAWVDEWIGEKANRIMNRLGVDNLDDLDGMMEQRLHKEDPLWWYDYRETPARADEESTTMLIAHTFAIRLWLKVQKKQKYKHLFDFTKEEAEQMLQDLYPVHDKRSPKHEVQASFF